MPVGIDNMPEIDFSALRKILELEQKKGFSDSTVFGGLDKFIRQWTEKTLEAVSAPSVLVKIRGNDCQRTGSLDQRHKQIRR